jgi:hypothetical protein
MATLKLHQKRSYHPRGTLNTPFSADTLDTQRGTWSEETRNSVPAMMQTLWSAPKEIEDHQKHWLHKTFKKNVSPAGGGYTASLRGGAPRV